jgi:putative ABC transport system permease protein
MWFRILKDFKLAFRSLAKNPVFASVAIVMLALGISINTALFSIVNGVLLEPLRYPHPERLVRVWPSMMARGVPRASMSLVDYRSLRSKNRSLEELAAYYSVDYNLLSKTQPERIRAAATSASLFRVLEVGPIVGASYTEESETWGSHRVAMLSEKLWRQSFGANPSIVGQAISLNDQSYVVAGIMPSSFEFPDETTQVWVPLSFAKEDPLAGGDHYFLSMVGRLKAGLDIGTARAELGSLMPHINPNLGVSIEDLKTFIVGETRTTLLFLTAAVALVLLIACINVASLLIIKANSRRRELSVRVALGAGQGHLIQQVLIEGVVLAFTGGVIGLIFAFYFVKIIKTWSVSEIPRLQEIGLDYRVLLFTLAVSVFTGLLFGVVPAWRASRVKPAEALKEISRTSGSHGKSNRHNALIIGELSFSMALLICAGLLILSLVHLQNVSSGFQSEHTLTARLNLSPIKYPEPQRAVNAMNEIVRQLHTLPEVKEVGATTLLPLAPGDWNTLFAADGQPAPRSFADVPVVRDIQVTPDYFQAIGATLKSGRYFTEHDGSTDARVVIVNEALARKFWPGESALGKTGHPGPPESLIGLPPGAMPKFTIVGVVGDMRHDGLDKETKPTMYVPYPQAGQATKLALYLVLRAKAASLPMMDEVSKAIHTVDPTLPIADVRTMDERLHNSLARRLHTMWLLCIFAGSALLLAAIGVYGSLSYYVSLRTREVGLRMALGATAFDVLRLILRQAAVLTGIGISLGIIVGFVFAQLAKGLLFGVQPINVPVYGGTAVVLFGISLVGAYMPAKRASRVDPVQALRYE